MRDLVVCFFLTWLSHHTNNWKFRERMNLTRTCFISKDHSLRLSVTVCDWLFNKICYEASKKHRWKSLRFVNRIAEVDTRTWQLDFCKCWTKTTKFFGNKKPCNFSQLLLSRCVANENDVHLNVFNKTVESTITFTIVQNYEHFFIPNSLVPTEAHLVIAPNFLYSQVATFNITQEV